MSYKILLNQISRDTGIEFHDFIDNNEMFITAKSHFFDFNFGPTYVEVVDRYTLPGPKLKKYMNEVLPFRIDYIVDNYYDILVEEMTKIQRDCIVCELRDEEESEI